MIFVNYISWVHDPSERPPKNNQDIRTARHLSWVTIHLYSRLNFSSLKDWFTIANYFFYKKCFSEWLLHNRADELIRWFPSSECDFWTMNKNYRKSAWGKWFSLLQHKPKRKWVTSRFSTVFDFVMRYKYLKIPFFSVLFIYFSFRIWLSSSCIINCNVFKTKSLVSTMYDQSY